MSDPSRERLLEFYDKAGLGHEPEISPEDFEVAMYWFAHDYHGGQWSNLYSLLSTSPYRPGPLRSSVEGEGEAAERAYEILVDKFGGK